MRLAHPRWVLAIALLSILPLVLVGFWMTRRLAAVTEMRYEQEVVAARYAGELAGDYILQDLQTYIRPRRESLTYAYLKGEEKFRSALRRLYFTSGLIDYPQFVGEAILRDVSADVVPAGSSEEEARHDCSEVVAASLRGLLVAEGRERMGYDPNRHEFRKNALMVDDEEFLARAPLHWLEVDPKQAGSPGCAGCVKELERLGGATSECVYSVLSLSFSVPGRDDLQPGMFGAVVPGRQLLREIVGPALARWGKGDEALPRHGLRVVDRDGNLLLPETPPPDPVRARALKTAQALYSEELLGEGSPWRLEVVALSGFDLDAMRAENDRWRMLLSVAALLLALGALLMGRGFIHQIENSRLRSHLLSNISHELKTPLSLIRLYTETLESGRTRSEEESQKFLGIINRESKRLSHLIDNLLDVQRIEQGRKHYSYAHVRPDRVVRNTVEAYRFQLTEEGFDLRLDIDEGLPLLHVDEEAVAQALINLLDNAAKYSDTVKEIRVACGQRHDMVCISVQDRGIGIPVREQEKIFQSFYRVEKSLRHDVKGSGLGLAVVAYVARAHGGRVEVESTPGKGSTFTLCLSIDFTPDGS